MRMHFSIALIVIISSLAWSHPEEDLQANDAGKAGKRNFNFGWNTGANVNVGGLGFGWGNGFNVGTNGFGTNNGIGWGYNNGGTPQQGGVNWGQGMNWGQNGVNWGNGFQFQNPYGPNVGVNQQTGLNWNFGQQAQVQGQYPAQVQGQYPGQVPGQYANNLNGQTGNVVANNNNNGNGQNGNSVTSNCNNGVCQACVNGRCFIGQYSYVIAHDKCPAAACEAGCQGMIFNTDNCPTCRCNGYSAREPCASDQECLSPNGKCTNGLCRYAPLPEGLPKYCSFSYQCPETEGCVNSRCQHDSANRRHVTDRPCVFANNCPSGYTCESNQMTCWQNVAGK